MALLFFVFSFTCPQYQRFRSYLHRYQAVQEEGDKFRPFHLIFILQYFDSLWAYPFLTHGAVLYGVAIPILHFIISPQVRAGRSWISEPQSPRKIATSIKPRTRVKRDTLTSVDLTISLTMT